MNTPTPEDIAEGEALQKQWHHTAPNGFLNWSQFAMLARQRREAKGERVLPVFTAEWYVETYNIWIKISKSPDFHDYLTNAINTRIAASGFAQAPIEADTQARIDEAVLAEREACAEIVESAKGGTGVFLAHTIRARTTKPEIATPDIAPYGGFNCGNCRFMVKNYGHILGLCHRYPETIEFNANHWCGDHKPMEAGR